MGLGAALEALIAGDACGAGQPLGSNRELTAVGLGAFCGGLPGRKGIMHRGDRSVAILSVLRSIAGQPSFTP